jgi:broad specificity phosphatase PhoE
LIAYYLTHPQVEIAPSIPVPQWSLSEKGRARVEKVRNASWLRSITRIVSSDERKATETSAILATAIGIGFETQPDMGENDRSATGYLEPAAFEAAADCFFARPETSWKGWERAVDAAGRIAGAVDRILDDHDKSKPILFVGHGAVGTLLKCRVAGRAISRNEDQPGGGGNVFAFRLADRRLVCDWTPIENFEGTGHAD